MSFERMREMLICWNQPALRFLPAVEMMEERTEMKTKGSRNENKKKLKYPQKK